MYSPKAKKVWRTVGVILAIIIALAMIVTLMPPFFL